MKCIPKYEPRCLSWLVFPNSSFHPSPLTTIVPNASVSNDDMTGDYPEHDDTNPMKGLGAVQRGEPSHQATESTDYRSSTPPTRDNDDDDDGHIDNNKDKDNDRRDDEGEQEGENNEGENNEEEQEGENNEEEQEGENNEEEQLDGQDDDEGRRMRRSMKVGETTKRTGEMTQRTGKMPRRKQRRVKPNGLSP